jgi:hypothetical protein
MRIRNLVLLIPLAAACDRSAAPAPESIRPLSISYESPHTAEGFRRVYVYHGDSALPIRYLGEDAPPLAQRWGSL